jgi:hypothetical protein
MSTAANRRVGRARARRLTPDQADERRRLRLVAVAWGLLLLNVMPYTAGSYNILPIPSVVGKVLTQATLPAALLIALMVNKRLVIRPSVFLCLIGALALETVITAFGAQYLRGTGYRTFRLLEFVAVIWLTSAYWGRGERGFLFVKVHVKALYIVTLSALIGLAISPAKALGGDNRLQGAIWPAPSTQIAHYAAITIGLAVILWLAGMARGRTTLMMVIVSTVVLIMTHTRTALVALLAGLLVALLSMAMASARVRKILGITVVVVGVGYLLNANTIQNWLVRGEGTQQLTDLSGRTNFWGPLLAYPRTRFEMIFGFGVSNGQFKGLPIDSNWLDSYQDQGLFGVTVCAAILIFLMIAAFQQTRGWNRALVLFLTVYGVVASFTEDGITNASPYMLDVVVAASLLAPVVSELAIDRAHGRNLRGPEMFGCDSQPGLASDLPVVRAQDSPERVGNSTR